MSGASAQPRVRGLDGLRGLAIILVLLTHTFGVEGTGMVGVLIFFVLSGFLITSLLLTESRLRGRIDLPSFYLRRAVRLVPALLWFLVLFVAVTAAVEGLAALPDLVPGLAQAVLYLTDLTLGLQEGYRPELAHLWSLAVEEQFYLIWPVCLILFLKSPVAVRIRRMTWAIAVFMALRAASWLLASRLSLFVYALPTTWVDVIVIGSICAVIQHGAPSFWSRLARANRGWVPGFALALLVGYGAVPGSYRWAGTYVVGLPLLSLAACVLVTSMVRVESCWVQRVFSWAPLRRVGLVSYGLYLYNSTSIMLAQRWLGEGLGPRALGLGFAVVLALLSWRWVEKPVAQFCRARLGHRAMAPFTVPTPASVPPVTPPTAVCREPRKSSVAEP